MNFYTLTYDDAQPVNQQLNIPTNSDCKIGIKVFSHTDEGKHASYHPPAGGSYDCVVIPEMLNLYPQQVTLIGDDGSTISADPELTNGYVTFSINTGDDASTSNYKVQVKNDTIDGIMYSPVASGNNPRPQPRTAATVISSDNPIAIYPSDKLQAVDENGELNGIIMLTPHS